MKTCARVAQLAGVVFSSSRFSAYRPAPMDTATILAVLIAFLILIVALLYSTVGHAGASGYLAIMALFGMAPIVMKPTALMLNIIVAVVGTLRFYRAGFFSWRIFWPF